MNRLSEIIETYINGNITIAKNEFKYWKKNPIQVVQCSEIFGMRQTIKILKINGLSNMYIINSFYDYDRQSIDKAKEILLNNFY